MILCFLLFLFGCDGEFTVSEKELDLKVGQSAALTVKPEKAVGEIEWSSANPNVATIEDGAVTGVGEGETVVTAKRGKKEHKVTVKVSYVTVTFDTKGGSEIAAVKLSYGEKLDKPADPEKPDKVFSAWYIDADLKTAFDFNKELTEDLTLYAKWDDAEYDVTFKVEGEIYREAKVKAGEKVEKPEDPVKTGYNFLGWFFLYQDAHEVYYDFDLHVESPLEIYAKFAPRDDIPYAVKHLTYNEKTGMFDLADEESLIGTADAEVVIKTKEYAGLIPEHDEYRAVILPDGSLVVEIKYIEINYSFTMVLNGGNFTYETKAAMVDDFLNDYNTYFKTTYTRENLPLGAWVLNNFHTFLYDEKYHDKWRWMPAYLAVVGSNTNRRACADFATVSTAAAFNAINSNHIYAFSYEIRGFILDIKYTENTNWMSSDYSQYELGHGFWETFVEYREITSYENLTEPFTLPTTVYREGYNFRGWYLDPEFTKPVTKMVRDGTVYAKWEEKNPVTHILILNPVTELQKYATHQLEINILPADAFNKSVHFITSNDKVLRVSDTGLITAENIGTARITVKSAVRDVKAVIEITVTGFDDIDVEFSAGYDGLLYVGEEVTVTVKGVGSINDGDLEFVSKSADIATIDDNGLIKALKEGEAAFDIVYKPANETLLTVLIPVYPAPGEERIDKLLKLLKEASNPVVECLNASLLYDTSSNQQYFKPTYGSVNLYLFDDLNLEDKKYLINPQTMDSKHSGLMPSIEFITIHDTANISGGLTAHGNYWLNTSHNTSIHFTVGDYGVIQSLDTRYAAHHAGDGTSVMFAWEDTGVRANGKMNPDIDISPDGYYTFNDEKTPIKAPTKNGQILDKSYFTELGPNWKIGDNGNYYLGTTWFVDSQVARGVIGSKGGNLNSIGIEMCVNTSGDIYDTWQRTAKLVAKLIEDNDLDYSRVVQHNTFTGKNCPQSILYADYWDTFMEFIQIEHIIRTEYADAEIKLESHDPDLLDNTGRIISLPQTTKFVTYTITVKIGDEEKSIKLGSVIPGLSSWDQYDGLYAINLN
ncbi:MAG: InlB B-repeat-containing protein [Bacilli bacterium]